MHELTIALALVEQVQAAIREQELVRVHSVRVRLGPFSGVEPGPLKNAFELARAGTALAEAELVVVRDPDGREILIESMEVS